LLANAAQGQYCHTHNDNSVIGGQRVFHISEDL